MKNGASGLPSKHVAWSRRMSEMLGRMKGTAWMSLWSLTTREFQSQFHPDVTRRPTQDIVIGDASQRTLPEAMELIRQMRIQLIVIRALSFELSPLAAKTDLSLPFQLTGI